MIIRKERWSLQLVEAGALRVTRVIDSGARSTTQVRSGSPNLECDRPTPAGCSLCREDRKAWISSGSTTEGANPVVIRRRDCGDMPSLDLDAEPDPEAMRHSNAAFVTVRATPRDLQRRALSSETRKELP